MSLKDSLKGLFGKKPPPKKPAPKKQTTVLGPSRRAEMLEWAAQIHRGKAPMARGALDGALKEFRAKPPNPGDVDALTRMMRIVQAESGLRRLMNHREWRYLVLAGVRQLLVDAPPEAPTPPAAAKTARKIVVRR
jgi:hypothetical protein